MDPPLVLEHIGLSGGFPRRMKNFLKYMDSGIKLDNNKYNQKLPHIYAMAKCMANNYFFVIKSIYSAFTC